mgnify:CR=1 FL=1
MDISIYKLKTKFQNLLMPICEKLVKLKITPNQITVTTVLLNIIFAGIIYKFSNYNFLYLTVPIFLFLRMALNALDGMIANKFNQKTGIYGLALVFLITSLIGGSFARQISDDQMPGFVTAFLEFINIVTTHKVESISIALVILVALQILVTRKHQSIAPE